MGKWFTAPPGKKMPVRLCLSLQATVKLPLGDILCSSDEAQLMRLLIRLIKAKKVIKIGEMDI